MKTHEHNTKEKCEGPEGRPVWSGVGLGDREGEGCGSYFPTGLGAPRGRERCGFHSSLPALGAENMPSIQGKEAGTKEAGE